MSLSILHALSRPFGQRVMGVGRAAQLVLTSTTVPRRKCLISRRGLQEAVRYCSGSTLYTRDTYINTEDDHTMKKFKDPNSLSKTEDIDPYSLETSENFLLPSHQQQYQNDLLLNKIKYCVNLTSIMSLYKRHKDIMESKHTLMLFNKLAELENASKEDTTWVYTSDEFQALCEQLFVQCRRMDVFECLRLLKNISRLRLAPNSKFTQAVLQMIKHQINDLTLKHLIFLEFLLRKMPLTTLSDALLTAVPILISNALTTSKVSELSMIYLSQILSICSKRKVGRAGIVLQEIYRRGSVSSASIAMSLTWSLTRMSSRQLRRELLSQDDQLTREVIMKECLETLTREVDSLTPQQIESTLSKVCGGYALGDHSCYNERFLNTFASSICRHTMSFSSVTYCISKMMKINYLSNELVHYAVELLLSQPKDIQETNRSLMSLVSALVGTPISKDTLKDALDIIITHKSLALNSEQCFEIPLLYLAIDLLSVDYHHQGLIDFLTSPHTLSRYMSNYSKNNTSHRRLLEVDQFLGEVVGSPQRVPDAFLEAGRAQFATQQPSRSVLKAMLSQILHHPNDVISGVISEGGFYIDHLLVLDADGVPLRLTLPDNPPETNPSVTSLNIPQNATRLAILDIGSSGVFRPTNTLKGAVRVRQRVLEATGYTVRMILQPILFQHQDEEKVLYVRRELTEAGLKLDWESREEREIE